MSPLPTKSINAPWKSLNSVSNKGQCSLNLAIEFRECIVVLNHRDFIHKKEEKKCEVETIERCLDMINDSIR